ncbi:hypothetical protein AB0383_00095 [Amycolatopsis sp. NPDC051373]|uniref:hypothetical protein n=1 Tax=Amycolatopsis sp. NPDC051373 TaxID=3155801 RepID=UPI00344B12B1
MKPMKGWFGQGRMPPKVALSFAILYTLMSFAWLVLALFGGLAGWRVWGMVSVAVLNVPLTAYWWMGFAHSLNRSG